MADHSAGATQRILGRSQELDRIDEMVQRLATGRGSVIVLIGPPGTGLTTLLHETIVRAGESVPDVRAVHVPSGLLAGDPRAAVTAIASGGVADMYRQFADAAEPPLADAGAALALDDPRLIRLGVDALRALSEERPLLVSVDDLPVTDEAFFRPLTSLAAGIADLPVMVVATSHLLPRSSFEESPVGPLWVRPVPPLGVAESVELVRAAAGRWVPRAVAATIRDRTGGIPGDLHAVCLALEPEQLAGAEPLPDVLPASPVAAETYRQWWHSRGPKERLLVLAAAVAISPDRDVLEECADVALADVIGPDGRSVLREEHGRVTAHDPQLLSAVHALSSPREVRAAQTTLAACYPHASLDRHWLELRSGTQPTSELLDTLVEHAGALLDRGDTALVQSLVSDVARRLGRTTPPAELLLLGGVAALYCGHSSRAVSLLTGVVGDAPATLFRTFPLLLVALTYQDNGVPHHLVASWLARLAEEQPGAAASISALASRLCVQYGDEEGSRRYLERAESLVSSGALADPGPVTELPVTRALAGHRSPGGPPDPVAVLGVRRPGLDIVGWLLELQGLAQLIDSGEWGHARAVVSDLRTKVRRCPAPLLRAELTLLSVRLHLWTGEYRLAEQVVASAVEQRLPLHVPQGGAGVSLLAQTAMLRGRETEAKDWLIDLDELAQDAQRHSPVLAAALHEALGLRALLDDRSAEAVEHLTRAAREWRVLPSTLIDLAHLLWQAGRCEEHGEAVALLRAHVDGSDTADVSSLPAALELLRARTEALVSVVVSVARATRDSVPPAHEAHLLEFAADRVGALTAEQYAAQAREAGADLPEQAEAYRLLLLERARYLHEKSAAVARMRRTEREIARLHALATRSDADISTLTAEELTIARLVQRGATNREIAGALYVSVRTVELRLTGIYRKMEISTRKELRRLASLAPADRTAR
ncbi:helix-turn-helix transcriptional regulator [Georgenia halophila]